MSILGALVKNTGHHFHVELATKKWMDRLIKMVRTTRDSRVREKVWLGHRAKCRLCDNTVLMRKAFCSVFGLV